MTDEQLLEWLIQHGSGWVNWVDIPMTPSEALGEYGDGWITIESIDTSRMAENKGSYHLKLTAKAINRIRSMKDEKQTKE